MSTLLDRIQALIARTASSSEEEARTSAVIACRLIREHKIMLLDPKQDNDASPTGEDGEPLEGMIGDLWDFLERRERRQRAQGNAAPRRAAQAQARAYKQHYDDAAPRSVYPFDPFTAPFVVVQAYVKTRSGIDVHDNGDGSYSASSGYESFRGSWPETVRFMFTIIESRRPPRR